MKDFLGKELAHGDDVVFTHNGYGGGYLLEQGKIVAFTPRNIRINFVPSYCTRNALSEETLKQPDKVVKVTIDPV